MRRVALGSASRLCEPVAHAERVHRDRVERFGLGHERVANKRDHSTAKNAQPSAVVHCAVYPNTHGPVTRRARCRAGSERVQRDRVEPFIAGHERVTIQSEPRARDSHFQFWEVNSEIGDGAFEISAGERGCTFAGSEV